MGELAIALFIGIWTILVGVAGYIRLRKEYGKDKEKK